VPFDNILDFVEGATGLGMTLLPVQRFILKLYYGIELDTSDRRIQIHDHLQERLRYSLTESDYLDYLHGEGRCNTPNQSALPRPGLILAAGRRTGKTTLAELIASYTVIQLLQAGNPHEIFGFPNARLNLVATRYIGLNRSMREVFLSGIVHGVGRCLDLRDSLYNPSTQSPREIRFTTPQGRSLDLDRGNLSILAVDCRTRVHGSTSSVTLILDELAYMPNEQDIIDSSLPTILPTGCYSLMSTPRRAEGAFYNNFRSAMNGNSSSTPLALQIPTWEVQPNLASVLRHSFDENPSQFYIEYGAQWGALSREVHIEIRV
jgi:hypothetical protein